MDKTLDKDKTIYFFETSSNDAYLSPELFSRFMDDQGLRVLDTASHPGVDNLHVCMFHDTNLAVSYRLEGSPSGRHPWSRKCYAVTVRADSNATRVSALEVKLKAFCMENKVPYAQPISPSPAAR